MSTLSIHDVKTGSVIESGGRKYFVKWVCRPCKLISAYAVNFIPYKRKRGDKPVVIYKSIKFDKATLLSQ